MKLLIKNMVCPRCIIAVKEILAGEGVTVKTILLLRTPRQSLFRCFLNYIK